MEIRSPRSLRDLMKPRHACNKDRQSSSSSRARVPVSIKSWILEEQKKQDLNDGEAALLLTKTLRERGVLSQTKRISRTAVLSWRRKAKQISLAQSKTSLTVRPPLYKELQEATKKLLDAQVESLRMPVVHVRITQGDIRTLAELLLPVIVKELEKRIISAVESGDIAKADRYRPALGRYGRCRLSLNWARQFRSQLAEMGTRCISGEPTSLLFSSIGPPLEETVLRCALHGLTFLQAEDAQNSESHKVALSIRTQLKLQLSMSCLILTDWEISRLRDGGWLTDSIVYGYCALIEKRSRTRWLRTTLPRLWVMDPILLCSWLRGQEKRSWKPPRRHIRKRRNFDELLSRIKTAEILVFPLARDRNGDVGTRTSVHWTLVVIMRRLKEIWHLCSLHGEDNACGRYESASLMCADLVDTISDTAEAEKCFNYTKVNNCIFGKSIPMQSDSSSCGAYVCYFVDIIERNQCRSFPELDAASIRMSIYAAFLTNQDRA